MKINRIDHVGVVVNDFEKAKSFFLDIGFEVTWEGKIEGGWVEEVIGLRNVKNEVAMLSTSDGEANIELIKFESPIDEKGIQENFSNTLGIRHICLNVKDLDDMVTKIKEKGLELMGEIKNYEDVYRLCYVRGPEGIILELAENIG